MALSENIEKCYAEATARGVKKIAGLKFGDRIKVKECGSNYICEGNIVFIDYKTGDISLQTLCFSLPLRGIDAWEIQDDN